jgi:DNA-binding Lrp family transcriptional regulator
MDEFDIKLLSALQSDGRLTNYELAERVGLSASQCSRRRSLLEESGVIEGYHAVLSGEAIGLNLVVFVHVTLATHSPENSKHFAKLIHGLEEVQEAYSLTGEADYLIKMVMSDLRALSRIITDVLLPHESVAHVRSSVVLDRLKQASGLPLAPLSTGREQGARKRNAARSRRVGG